VSVPLTLEKQPVPLSNFGDIRVIDLPAILEEGPPGMMTLEACFEATATD